MVRRGAAARGSARAFGTPNAAALAEPHLVITHSKARPLLMLVSLGPALVRKPFDIKVPHFYHLSQSYKIKIRERFWGVAGTEFSRILTTYIVEGLAMYSVVLMAA